MITAAIKTKIQNVISVFETSSVKARYDILVVMADGPGKRKQITYGKHQVTEYGNLKAMLTMYCNSYGNFAPSLRPYLHKIGVTPLHDNYTFRNLLIIAASDPTMQEVQDNFFDQYYWNPAVRFFQTENFKLPLSMLVIYDSFIHSGGIPAFLRNRFAAKTPAAKGDEKLWIRQYVAARDKWLETHSDALLRNTDYRTDTFLQAIEEGNWELKKPVVCKFNSGQPSKWITIP